MKVELYLKPKESPTAIIKDKDIRINYNDKWVDFRDGEIRITDEKKIHGD